VIGADESRRVTGGAATSDAQQNSGMPSDCSVAGNVIHQFNKNVYGKPRAFNLGKPLFKDAEASRDSLASSNHRPSDGPEIRTN